jgi:hypothetical protein
MVLIYSHTTSARLQYICKFIFENVLNVGFKITIDSEEFRLYSGVCINYSDRKIKDEELRVENVKLLFEENIAEQKIECFTTKDYKAIFKIENSDIGFDIFAASFYLLSRYEEYLTDEKDMYGRYSHENSLAFKEGFLRLPLINIWLKNFAETLKAKFSTLSQVEGSNFQFSTFNYLPTYDIDIAYSYKHKGVVRNIGGFFKSPSLERIKVLLGLKQDPFDSYAWINELHTTYNLNAIYFFLMAEKTSTYDKNIALHKNALWRLIKLHAKKFSIGLHPSWQSAGNLSILKKEKTYLEAMSELSITNSRQHYIKFNLPEGYRQLLEAGITNDYSMGYGHTNGFRASVATAFNWFDVEKNEETNLVIHPFCFMDANSYYEQKQTAEESFDELLHYYKICKEVNGTLITIFHNNFLGTDKNFKGWREMYEAFVKEVHKGL